jgi:predicted ATPase/DNA-binding XRE family transcriptional regulator
METAPGPSFADLLRRRRLAAGLSQEALAERAGLSIRAISDLERGVRRAPYRETVRLISDALALDTIERAALEAAITRGRGPRVPSTQLTHTFGLSIPAEVSALIGREHDVADLLSRIRRRDSRLITLSGPPGIGKTRLALAVASRLVDEMADGVVFVGLAPISDARLVPTSIMQALGLAEAGKQPSVLRIQDALRAKRLLLLLDNFEHVIDAAPVVSELLTDCPDVVILVTSRATLRLRGEQEYPVPPLALPGGNGAIAREPNLESLATSPAVELFIQRVQAAQPHFVLTRSNAASVVEICQRLDGLPLAIELAAARCKVLTPQGVLTRLEHRLDLLNFGARDAPARQQTLRAAIEWSYNLLSLSEQILFRRIGVFIGGCSLTAVERVCNADGALGGDVLDVVTALIDQSLVQQHEGVGGEPRLLMLETLREYSVEQLHAAGERQPLERWHAAYTLALTDEAERHLYGGDRGPWLDRLNEEQDNIRATLRWSLAHDDPEAGLRLVGSLWLWFQRRLLIEGRQWTEDFLALTEVRRNTSARARALFAAGHFAWLQGDVRIMRSRIEEAISIGRKQADETVLGRALPFLGLSIDDDHETARQLAVEGVEYCRRFGGTWDLALALTNLGRIEATWGHDDNARQPLTEATTLFRALGDTWLLALPLTSLGAIEHRSGHRAEAQAAFAEALPCFRSVEDRRNTTQVMTNLGHVALADGEVDRARAIFAESLIFGQVHGDGFNVPACLRGLSGVALARGNVSRAVRLAGAADTLTAATGSTRWPAERLGGPAGNNDLQSKLGEQEFVTEWESGQRMSLKQAIDEALLV